MATNEFYYDDTELITREEAHALSDTSKLIVSDLSRTKAFLTTMLSDMNGD